MSDTIKATNNDVAQGLPPSHGSCGSEGAATAADAAYAASAAYAARTKVLAEFGDILRAKALECLDAVIAVA